MKLTDILVVGLATVGIYYLLKKMGTKPVTKAIAPKEKSIVPQPEINLSNAPVNTEDSPVVVIAPSVNQEIGSFDVVGWVTE